MKQIKRIISPKGLLIFLCLAAIILTAGAQKVSAKEQKPYLIKVNRACNTITIYEQDEKGDYIIPIKAMACSVGRNQRTITGTFQTKEKYRWKSLMGDVWGQYATRIVGGILFHSVYYYEKSNPATLATKEFNKLGTAASHGCIRLTVGDAKWIYDNCSVGTTVTIYDDKDNPGPLGKPEVIKLPKSVRWDPTDPSDNNPYKDKIPRIAGAKDIVAKCGEEINLLKGVTAKSSVGANITTELKVTGTVDTTKPGEYIIIYSVTDSLGRTVEKTITVTINGYPSNPEFTGITNKVVTGEVIVNKAFALSGVEVINSGTKLNKDMIEVTIDKINNDDYYITYKVAINDKAAITANASVHVDREAPVLSGIKDFWLEAGELPTKGYVLEGVTVSDNYSEPEDIKLNVSIDECPDGTYLITYEASDEAGNVATAQAKVNN